LPILAPMLRCPFTAHAMTNKYYQPGEQRAARVGDLFAKVAPRYDLINDLQSFGLHRRWKQALIEMAQVQPGEKALDVCCGTGDIAFALQEAGAGVTAVDFSPAMLAVAEKRAGKITSKSPSGSLQFLAADAMQLPFADESFQIVTVGYGLRNLSSWERGLEEMTRVATPGGRILILEFGKPDNKIWRGIYFTALRFLVPLFGKIFCQDASTYSYIMESLNAYPAHHAVTEKMQALKLQHVEVRLFLGGAMSLHRGIKGVP
jgi:demethylmenaquinone methyltransferase/2-methoxy-6-polyprenyl-1,4-benzoquinol methylase